MEELFMPVPTTPSPREASAMDRKRTMRQLAVIPLKTRLLQKLKAVGNKFQQSLLAYAYTHANPS